MEDVLQFLSTLITIIFALLVRIFTYYVGKSVTNETKTCNAPQAGGALPILGHLHLFGGQKLLHKTVGAMADKYGPTFTIRMGSNSVLILNSWEMARECFTVPDKVLSTRPAVTAPKLLGYDCALFGLAPYGPYWREMRKITTVELLSNHRFDRLKHVRVSEVEMAVRELYGLWSSTGCPANGILVDMKQLFGDLAFNIVLRMVAGKRYFVARSEDGKAQYCQKLIRDFIRLFGVPVLSDAIPILRWLDINGHKKEMKKTAKKLDQLVGEWLEEHKQRRLSGEQDFMDVMLRVLHDTTISCFDTDTNIKATSLILSCTI